MKRGAAHLPPLRAHVACWGVIGLAQAVTPLKPLNLALKLLTHREFKVTLLFKNICKFQAKLLVGYWKCNTELEV